MAHARHDASLGDHGDGAESKFLGPYHGGDGDVAPGADAAVDAQDNAIAQAVTIFLQIVKIIAAASVKVGIPPAFPHRWLIVVSFSHELPSRPVPLHFLYRCIRHSIPSFPTATVPSTSTIAPSTHSPLLMLRHADCRPLHAASTAAYNASYPPFKTGVNKINNVRFQPPSPLPPSSPPSSPASAYLSPPRRLRCCDVRSRLVRCI